MALSYNTYWSKQIFLRCVSTYCWFSFSAKNAALDVKKQEMEDELTAKYREKSNEFGKMERELERKRMRDNL